MTIATYAVVEKGVVTNVIAWDGNTDEWAPAEGQKAIAVPADVSIDIGWTYSNGKFSAPR